MGKLEGRTALITGAARGSGLAITWALAREGAAVVLADVDGVQLQVASETLRADGMQVLEVRCDVSNRESARKTIRLAVESFQGLDILVNNAGIVRDKSFVKMTHQMWTEVLSVNLDGAFYCTKAVIEGMLERKYRRIVNISSVIGRMGNRGQANYAASKAGLIALSQTLAKEFARKGITVNAVAPGFIETDMLKSVPKEIMEKILAQIPLGRLGDPSEVAGAVAYLVSEDADYITGQVIDINGGLYI